MAYNPQIHHRRSIRLKEYDYSRAGLYFITICCQDRNCRFGDITVGASLADAQFADAQFADAQFADAQFADAQFADAQFADARMILNEYGTIARDEWEKLPKRFPNVELDVFQVMPNHVHGIIVLNEPPTVWAGASWAGASPAPTVGHIIGAYKSLVAKACLDICKSKNEMLGKLWQRNYYEHIIRSEPSYRTISDYIINNPAKWKEDKFYEP